MRTDPTTTASVPQAGPPGQLPVGRRTTLTFAIEPRTHALARPAIDDNAPLPAEPMRFAVNGNTSPPLTFTL